MSDVVLEVKQQGKENDNGFSGTIYRIIKENGKEIKEKNYICIFSDYPKHFFVYYKGEEPKVPLVKGIKIIIDGKKEIFTER